jgi:hypothetical protein
MPKIVILLVTFVFLLAACNDDQPPTQIYVVLSPTPDTSTADATEDTTANNPAVATPTDSAGPIEESPSATARPTRRPTTEGAQPTQRPTSSGAALTNQASATPAPEIFPTSTVAEVQIAETVFEHGRMFWLRHNRQIWVMVASKDNENAGDWYCYNDTFEEGQQEIDPDLVPPEGMYQPRRGFGKLWREHSDLKEGLGWAITPEFELTSNYTYIPGGYVENNEYFGGPGEHRLTTLYNDTVSFFEGEVRGDCQGGTWRIAPAQ